MSEAKSLTRWYRGRRTPEGSIVERKGTGGWEPLPLRLDLFNHSPSGFEWGFGGSGPAQLALALLADNTTDEQAVALHQDFKFRAVSQWTLRDTWELPAATVRAYLSLEEALREPLQPGEHCGRALLPATIGEAMEISAKVGGYFSVTPHDADGKPLCAMVVAGTPDLAPDLIQFLRSLEDDEAYDHPYPTFPGSHPWKFDYQLGPGNSTLYIHDDSQGAEDDAQAAANLRAINATAALFEAAKFARSVLSAHPVEASERLAIARLSEAIALVTTPEDEDA